MAAEEEVKMTQTLEDRAREIARQYASAWELLDEKHKQMCVEPILAVLRDVEREALELAAKEVPANWCDPLLTGTGNKLGEPPWGCPQVESLLSAIKANIRALQGRK